MGILSAYVLAPAISRHGFSLCTQKGSAICGQQVIQDCAIMTMGVACSRCCRSEHDCRSLPSVDRTDAQLIAIKNHPYRKRRRSSVVPTTPKIAEDQLEYFCEDTGIEPDVPANEMKARDVKRLIRRISINDRFLSQFGNEQNWAEQLEKMRSDPTLMQSAQERVALQLRNKYVEGFCYESVAPLLEIFILVNFIDSRDPRQTVSCCWKLLVLNT